jgi:hypothetical protein
LPALTTLGTSAAGDDHLRGEPLAAGYAARHSRPADHYTVSTASSHARITKVGHGVPAVQPAQ